MSVSSIDRNDFIPTHDSTPSQAPSEKEIQEYLEFGIPPINEKEIEALKEKSQWSCLGERFGESFIDRATEYANLAENQSTPEAKAFYFCKAKIFVEKAFHLFSWVSIHQPILEKYTLGEATACEQAATNKGKASKEGGLWLLRGAKALYDPVFYNPGFYIRVMDCSTKAECKNLEKAAFLWNQLGETFSSIDHQLAEPEKIALFYTNAARALDKASTLQQRGEDSKIFTEYDKQALQLLDRAIAVWQKTSPSITDPVKIAHFTKKIANLQQRQLNLLYWNGDSKSKEEKATEAFESRLKAAEQFEKRVELNHEPLGLIEQAVQLRKAAFITDDAEKRLELLLKAKAITERVWKEHHDDALYIKKFHASYHCIGQPVCWKNTLDAELGILIQDTVDRQKKI